LFAPLTHQTYSLGSTFILDPLLALVLLLGYLGSLWKRTSLRPAQLSALLAVLLIGVQFAWKQQALDAGHAYARAQGWNSAQISAEPRPIAPFNWTVIVREGERYHYAHLKLNTATQQAAAADANWLVRALAAFQPPQLANWQTAAQFGEGQDSLLARDIWARPEFGFFRWFASAPVLYRIDHHPNGACVWFEDLRFEAPGRESPFRFGLCGPDWKSYRLSGDGQALRLR
jgi:inner membrane protein